MHADCAQKCMCPFCVDAVLSSLVQTEKDKAAMTPGVPTFELQACSCITSLWVANVQLHHICPTSVACRDYVPRQQVVAYINLFQRL